MNNDLSIKNKYLEEQPLLESAQKRVAHFKNHTVSMAVKMGEQNQKLSKKASEISDHALKEVMQEIGTIDLYLKDKDTFRHKDVKELNQILKKSEDKIAKILASSQRKTLRTLTFELLKDQPFLLIPLRVIFCYREALNKMVFATQTLPTEISTQMERERYDEYMGFQEQHLKKREGVFKIGEMVWIEPKFTSKELKAQMESYSAQVLSDRQRNIIKKDVKVGNSTFKSEQHPLNAKYDDARRGILGENRNPFGSIFGDKGLSSENRQEKHLINGYLSKLGEDYKCFRHGILSSKLLKPGKERTEESKNAAKELITAALIETLAAGGITLDEASKRKDPISLNLTSLSIVTPDDVRRYMEKHKSEYTMLNDQIQAFKALENTTMLEVGGVKVKVQIKINAFNFGVNDAVKSPFLTGRERQFKLNQVAWNKMKEDLENLKTAAGGLSEPIESLQADIEKLMQDEHAYIKGGNQYEIGARLLNLANLMTSHAKGKNLVYMAALNCMSGKDRTGLMDCLSKALYAMYMDDGNFPTHAELQTEAGQDKLMQYLVPFLMESGGLEITEINTGAIGYKIRDIAKRAVKVDDDLFAQLQGFSGSVSA